MAKKPRKYTKEEVRALERDAQKKINDMNRQSQKELPGKIQRAKERRDWERKYKKGLV